MGALVNSRRLYNRLLSAWKEQNLRLFAGAKKTLNPQTCRGLVDAFLVRQQSLEVRRPCSITSELRVSGVPQASRSSTALYEPTPSLLMRDLLLWSRPSGGGREQKLLKHL